MEAYSIPVCVYLVLSCAFIIHVHKLECYADIYALFCNSGYICMDSVFFRHLCIFLCVQFHMPFNNTYIWYNSLVLYEVHHSQSLKLDLNWYEEDQTASRHGHFSPISHNNVQAKLDIEHYSLQAIYNDKYKQSLSNTTSA